MANKKVLIINGPNLNMLGKREPEVYGSLSFEEYLEQLRTKFPEVDIMYFQSNIEGEIISMLQTTDRYDAAVINLAGYSHTSVSIMDTIKAINKLVVEVHISNVHAREDFRQKLLTASACKGVISGLGMNGYELAVRYCIQNNFAG